VQHPAPSSLHDVPAITRNDLHTSPIIASPSPLYTVPLQSTNLGHSNPCCRSHIRDPILQGFTTRNEVLINQQGRSHIHYRNHILDKLISDVTRLLDCTGLQLSQYCFSLSTISMVTGQTNDVDLHLNGATGYTAQRCGTSQSTLTRRDEYDSPGIVLSWTRSIRGRVQETG